MRLVQNSNPEVQEKEATAIYLRVSTKRQEEEGLSLETQINACKKLAQDKDLIVPDELIFKENTSASRIYGVDYNIESSDLLLIRPGIKKMLLYAEEKRFKHLIVYSRDRLTRVAEEALAIELVLSNYGITIHYAKEGESINTNSKSIDRFIHLIFLCISEYESGFISLRVKAGNKNCIEKGYWAGGITPIGYIRKVVPSSLKKKNTLLMKSDFESHLVKTIYDLYLSGIGYKRIADIMNKQHGYISWSKSKIEAIIKNQTYSGSIIWDKRGGRRHPGKHEIITSSPYSENIEIISNKDWQISKNFRIERNESKDPYYNTSKYILKNKLYCSICKNEMKPINPGKNKTEVYNCSHCTKNSSADFYNRIPCKDVENLVLNYIKTEVIDNINNSNVYYNYLKLMAASNETVQNFINELDKRIASEKSNLSKLSNIINDSSTPQNFKSILVEQTAIYSNLINQYETSKSYYNTLFIGAHKSEKEFISCLLKWKDILFDPSLNEDTLILQRRKFITTFVDKIYVKKSKVTGEITVDEILFI